MTLPAKVSRMWLDLIFLPPRGNTDSNQLWVPISSKEDALERIDLDHNIYQLLGTK